MDEEMVRDRTKILRDRVKKVRQQMRTKRLGYLILTSPANVSYLTGFLGHDSWAILFGRNAYLITDSRYVEQARKECLDCKIIERKGPIAKAVAEIINRSKIAKPVGIENTCSVANAAELRKYLAGRLRITAGVVEGVRVIKDDTEIKAMAEAAKIGWQGLHETLKQLKAGVTESEVAGMLEFQIRKLGAQISFDTIVAFGANSARPHHQPGNKKLRNNDTILIDFGTKIRGYHSDMTRCFAFGKPTRGYEKVYNAVLQAQQTAIKMVRAGARIKDINTAAQDVLAACGLPRCGHGLGHGLGLAVHEKPTIAQGVKGKLEEGQVFTIEPGVYLAGKFGIRIEDDVLVTKTGCKILSDDKHFNFSGHEMRVLK